ncbi:MAG: ADOP family duplicated permease, partial [Terriglobia bacterium]
MDEELQSHLERQIEHNMAKGMGAEEARYAALRLFGGMEQLKEQCRDVRGVNFIETIIQDLRYGVRQLRRNPGFTAVAVLTLALGIGANTAVFSVVNDVLLRPLPYKDPGRLVWAAENFGPGPGEAAVLGPDFVAWKGSNRVFDRIGAFGGGPGTNLSGLGDPVGVKAIGVTVGFFPMLGVQPILGRTFTTDEGKQGHDHVALISERLWRSRLSSSHKILGKMIYIDNKPYTVVGVMPSYLRYPSADIWTPICLDDPLFSLNSPNFIMVNAIGRLKPGATARRVRSDLQLITERMNQQYPPQLEQFHAHMRVEVVPLRELLVRRVRSLLLILLGAVALVLLIACANVSNLVLSRAAARGKEFAVRAALGAGQVRLIRQLLAESLMLAVLGGSLGFFAGLWSVQLLKRLIPPDLPSEVNLDLRVFGFVTGIALLSVILFGLAPALLTSRPGLGKTLKSGGVQAGTSGRTHRLRSVMVVVEEALSLVLLIGAGLLVRSFAMVNDVHLGFNPHHVLTAQVVRPLTNGFQATSPALFFHQMLTRIRALPGVEVAGVSTHLPLSDVTGTATGNFMISGGGIVQLHRDVLMTGASPGYFRAMGIQLLKGRTFGDQDSLGNPPVVIMNETLARLVFKDLDPIGQHIRTPGPKAGWETVVGVVDDTRNTTLERQPIPEIFYFYALMQPPFITFVLRTRGDPQALAGALPGAIHSVDKNQAVRDVQTMDEIIAESEAPQWFRTLLVGLFALLALILAAIGIYGVMSYSVSQRTHEIGIRMALGAQQEDVLGLVIGQGMTLAVAGVGIGVVAALGLTRYLSSLLYGVKPTDPLTFGA